MSREEWIRWSNKAQSTEHSILQWLASQAVINQLLHKLIFPKGCRKQCLAALCTVSEGYTGELGNVTSLNKHFSSFDIQVVFSGNEQEIVGSIVFKAVDGTLSYTSALEVLMMRCSLLYRIKNLRTVVLRKIKDVKFESLIYLEMCMLSSGNVS